MSQHIFTEHDQLSFASLSGDYNPMHVDPVSARRTFLGGMAVHGIHLLLWSLERLAIEYPFTGFSTLRVHFDRGAMVGDTIGVTWAQQDDQFIGKITGVAGIVTRIRLRIANRQAKDWTGPTKWPAQLCEEHSMESLKARSGTIAAVLPSDWQQMFPNLANHLAPDILATLLATTRLVGMVCPGLHSLYSSLQLTWDASDDITLRDLQYEVARADERVSLVDMNIKAGNFSGTIGAFLRPSPYHQCPLADIQTKIPKDVFVGQQALVIGGSRGLGELAAKLLIAGGANVTITWNQGEHDAKAIVDEAAALTLSLNDLHFDVADPPVESDPPAALYTHIYYFATPRIPASRPGHFNSEIFARLLDAYVTGFIRSVMWAMPRSMPDACIWYPSTTFLAKGGEDFAEYCAAKTCAEALCQQLATSMAPLRFITDRLPRLPTDQTRALADLTLMEGTATIYDVLIRLHGK